MYNCKKIKRITLIYSSTGPGTYAGDNTKVLDEDESKTICEEANEKNISIEMLLKSRENIESVVINTVVPFPEYVPKPAHKAEPETVEKTA